MQYRSGRLGAIESRYPADNRHPSKAFSLWMLPHGTAISFESGAHEYQISDDLRGQSVVFVFGSSKSRSVYCDVSTQSLTLNTTIDLLQSAGVGPPQGR